MKRVSFFVILSAIFFSCIVPLFSADPTFAEMKEQSDLVVEASVEFFGETADKNIRYFFFSSGKGEDTTYTAAEFPIVDVLKNDGVLADEQKSVKANIFVVGTMTINSFCGVGRFDKDIDINDFVSTVRNTEQAVFFFKKRDDGLQLIYKAHYL